MNIDPTKVRQAASHGNPLVIQTALLPSQTELDLEEILEIFLNELNLGAVKLHLGYCLKELTGNAKKANTKRIYFLYKNLNIQDPADYQKGMATFKRETLGEIDRYLALLEKAGLHIRITFHIREGVLWLKVANNVSLAPEERRRADLRIAQARNFQSMEQAFGQILDESEGAGLGITILILMLRKLGLGDDSFSLDQTEEGTVATLRIPAAEVHVDLVDKLTDELVAVVDSLPPFPENLHQLLRLLDQPDVGFEDLARRLAIDPALTADLIRYINSAGKGRKARVTNLRDAVQLVGLQGIREMILPYGAQKLLEKFISKQKVLWTEAQRISFLALGMAREFRFERQDRDLAQIGGLLSNLGRIVVAYLHPDLHGKIQAFCAQKNITVDRFNALTQVINPAELAARVAEKWKFPTNLTAVLRHQLWPDRAPAELYSLICVVHLAVNLSHFEQGTITISQIDQKILETLGLGAPESLVELRLKINRE